MIDELTTGWLSLPTRSYVAAVPGALLAGLLIGIPTDIVPNPWFTRMTPIRPEDYLFLILSAVLTGALLATYLSGQRDRTAGVAAGGGLLSVFAVGCPICNKLVVALLGTSGALSYFAPIQPLIGIAAVGLAAAALVVRLRRLGRACSSGVTPQVAGAGATE